MKVKDPRNLSMTEIQLLMAIAHEGLELRQRVDRKFEANTMELTDRVQEEATGIG